MGLLSRSKPAKPYLDGLTTLPTLATALREAGLRPTGAASVCVKPVEGGVVSASEAFDMSSDEFGYTWLTRRTARDDIAQATSVELIAQGLATGHWSDAILHALLKRSGEGLRVIAMCVLVAGLALFPTGQRRRLELPIELWVLLAAFFERSVTAYVVGPGVLGVASGSVILILVGVLILAVRLRIFRPVGLRRVAA